MSSIGPADRWDHPVAFDLARGVGIIHGGHNPFPAEDTLEFDGVAWKEVEYGYVSPRSNHTMTYHPIQDRTYLFGGRLSEDFKSTYYNNTFEWNGHTKKWEYLFPATSPGKRAHHVMAYDSWRGVSVMYGGFGSPWPDGPITYYEDTWEWNGAVWVLRQEASPVHNRNRAAMVFDSRRGVIVLWGGSTSSFHDDMWEWDGQGWSKVEQGAPKPGPRDWHAMAYDESRGVIVLFGGRSTGGASLSDTWEYTPCYPDCERDCDLDIFDYLCFLDRFVKGSMYCDFERDGDLDLFDFLEFQDEFVNGCG